MEHCHHTSTPILKAHGEELFRSSRILTDTSGNVQAYGLDTNNEGIDNRESFSNTTLEDIGFKSAPLQYHPQVLTSNQRQGNLHHLNARRQRHGNGPRHGHRPQEKPARPHLTSKEYVAYKNRQRLDSGKDGAPVWDSVTEEAFQDALVDIIPMGRKKKTQHGKPFGRNELIAEYIYQRTGSVRNRKQVSSHIQVLNHVLRDVPEWDALVKASDDTSNSPSHQYYDTSIRDMVHGGSYGTRHMDHFNSNTPYRNSLPLPPFTLGSNTDHTEKQCVMKLNFVMWVSPPNPTPSRMTDQLHRYTEVQCCDTSSPTATLESVKNWRLSFPHLGSILEHTTLSQSCDIILLEASFQLMADFPPPACKLGINLELDFRHPTADMKGLTELHDWKWICVTRMYEHGKCFQQNQYHCDIKRQKMEIGKVSASFESKYWAEKFVNLIEKKKAAEETGNEGAISAADEKSRNFFSGLCAMQELVAYAPHEVPLLEAESKPPQGKRMVILLWKFSQAPAGQVGITTWQKLISPPDRAIINSPTSTQDFALPPLGMDKMVEDICEDPIYQESHSQQGDHTPYPFHETNLDGNTNFIGRDEYDINSRNDLDAFTAMQSSYNMLISQGNLSQSSFLRLEQFPFDYHQQEQSLDYPNPIPRANNFFELQQSDHPLGHDQRTPDLGMAPPTHRLPQLSRLDPTKTQEVQRQPLNDFDHSTHKMLQAQLGQHPSHGYDAEENALQEALAINDLGAQDHPHYSYSPKHHHYHQHHQHHHFHGHDQDWEMACMPLPPLSRYPSYASHHSHHSLVDEHPTTATNREAFETNRIVTAPQSHNSSVGAPINNYENGSQSHGTSISYNCPDNFTIDSATTLTNEIAIRVEGASDSSER